MPQRMKRTMPVEPGDHLPRLEGDLHPPLRCPPPPLFSEERRTRIKRFVVGVPPVPELSQLVDEAVREDISVAPTFGDLGVDPDPRLGLASAGVDVAHIQTDDFGKRQARAEGEAEGEMVASLGGGD